MPFKDDDSGKTNNIYKSWITTAGWLFQQRKLWIVKELDQYTPEELQHLKWLIEQQIGVIENAS